MAENDARRHLGKPHLPECIAILQENLQICRDELGETDDQTLYCMRTLGIALNKARRTQEAIANFQELFARFRETGLNEHPHFLGGRWELADLLAKQDDDEALWGLLDQSSIGLSEYSTPSSRENACLTYMHPLYVYCEKGKLEAATQVLSRLRNATAEIPPDEAHRFLRPALVKVAFINWDAEKLGAAESLLREAVAISKGHLYFNSLQLLGRLLKDKGDYEESETFLLEAANGMLSYADTSGNSDIQLKAGPGIRELILVSIKDLISLYELTGNSVALDQWQAKLEQYQTD